MEVSISGLSKQLVWLSERLRHQGYQVQPATQPLLPDNEDALLFETTLIDVGCRSITRRQQQALQCQISGLDYVELAGPWLSVGQQLGFILFVGAPIHPVATSLQPLLDHLAPQQGAWLYCGPPGAATFTASVFDALQHGCLLAGRAVWPPGASEAQPYHLTLLAQQQQLADKLLLLAQHYLTLLQLPTVTALPLCHLSSVQSTHYAAQLAYWVIAALGLARKKSHE